ncbi:hypothetical protein EVA_08593 [gut metagenome]|uniref:Uncharacterized protein n=1 Tax=gut metagenome TaxID=749906 RepID=J9GSQ2_9ZZZZ
MGVAVVMNDIHVRLGARRHIAAFTHQFNHAFHPHRETDPRSRTAAEHFNERIVTTAAADRTLGAELIRNPFKDGMVVIIQTADKTGIDHIVNAGGAHHFFHSSEESAAFFTEVIQKTRSLIDEILHVGILRIENTQRIGVETALGFFIKLIAVSFEILNQRFAVSLAFGQSAERIKFQTHMADTELLPEAVEHNDHFRVDVGTRHPHCFSTELIELTITAALRTFMTEHRTAVPQTLGCAVKQIIFIYTTNDSGRAFRTKRQLIAVHAVGKGIHFLFDNIGDFTHPACKNLGIFKNRGTDFLVAITFKNADSRLLNMLPDGGVLRKHVVHALDAGEFFFTHFLFGYFSYCSTTTQGCRRSF